VAGAVVRSVGSVGYQDTDPKMGQCHRPGRLGAGQRERGDVDDEDADEGEAAVDIEGGDPVAGERRVRLARRGLRGGRGTGRAYREYI